MKRYGRHLSFVLMAFAVSGCAKDNLDPLHLVSTEEISVQKRQAGDAAAESKPDEALKASETAVEAAAAAPAVEPRAEPTKPAAQ